MKKTKDLQEYLHNFAIKDRLGSLIGCRVVELNSKECLSEYQVKKEHYNPNDILHGGALYAVMDSSQGLFLHFNLDPKFKHAVTGTSKIVYKAPVTEGVISIKTFLKSQEGRKIFVESVATDSTGNIVATLEETWIGILES